MSDTPDRARTCEDDGEQHNWVHSSLGIPGFPWLIQCSVCQAYDKRQMQADYERDVAAAEVRGWNAAVRQLAGEGCTWADGDCPNGTDCLSCKNLDALITERAKGDVEGWNAALSVVAADFDPEREMRHHSAACRCFGCDFQRRVAALRKPTEAQT